MFACLFVLDVNQYEALYKCPQSFTMGNFSCLMIVNIQGHDSVAERNVQNGEKWSGCAHRLAYKCYMAFIDIWFHLLTYLLTIRNVYIYNCPQSRPGKPARQM